MWRKDNRENTLLFRKYGDAGTINGETVNRIMKGNRNFHALNRTIYRNKNACV